MSTPGSFWVVLGPSGSSWPPWLLLAPPGPTWLRRSRVQLGGLGGARRGQVEPGGARRFHEEQRGARMCKEAQPGGARRSQEEPGEARRSHEEPGGGGGGGGCQGMPRDAKGRARSKRECDVETLATRILHKLLWQSKGVRKNDKQFAKQP